MIRRVLPIAALLMLLAAQPAGLAQNFPAYQGPPMSQGPALTVRHPEVEWQTLTVTATSYCLGGTTASGTHVGVGTVAVDPSVIPLGSSLYVQGYGWARATDTGSAIVGARIDVWLPPAHGCSASWAWGRRSVHVEVMIRG